MESKFNKPINLGNSKEFTIKSLAFIIKNQINPNLDFIYKKLPSDDPRRRNPSLALAKEVLNWEPKIEIKEGLTRTIDWFRKSL